MEKIKLDKAYWDSRYQSDNIKWDIGYVSQAIKNWFDIQENKNLSILIPGAGSGYEVSYAHQLGFKKVFYMDISSEAVNLFKSKNTSFPENRILSTDFFDLNLSSYFDVIIEQTFFCAQSPSKRVKYVKKTHVFFDRFFQGFLTFSGPSWRHLGANLAPTWGHRFLRF